MVLSHLPPPPKGRELLSNNVFYFSSWSDQLKPITNRYNLRRNNLRALILARASGLHPANVYRFHPLFAACPDLDVVLAYSPQYVNE